MFVLYVTTTAWLLLSMNQWINQSINQSIVLIISTRTQHIILNKHKSRYTRADERRTRSIERPCSQSSSLIDRCAHTYTYVLQHQRAAPFSLPSLPNATGWKVGKATPLVDSGSVRQVTRAVNVYVASTWLGDHQEIPSVPLIRLRYLARWIICIVLYCIARSTAAPTRTRHVLQQRPNATG